jgi:hypothetical protein
MNKRRARELAEPSHLPEEQVMKRSGSIALAATLSMFAQPCLAAEDPLDARWHSRSSAFAGFQARLPLGERAAKPVARLALGAMHGHGARSHRPLQVSGLELGLTSKVQPALFVGGQNVSKLGKRLRLGGSGDTGWLIAGGVALAAVAAILLLSADGSDGCIPEDPDCD